MEAGVGCEDFDWCCHDYCDCIGEVIQGYSVAAGGDLLMLHWQ